MIKSTYGLRGLVLLGFALIFTASVFGQINFDPELDVALNITTVPEITPSGGSGNVVVQIQLPENVHITSREMDFFFVQMNDAPNFSWKEAQYPKSVEVDGEAVYRGMVDVRIPFTLPGDLKPGDIVDVTGVVGYQICTEVEPLYCTPPVEREFSAKITVGEAVAKGAVGAETDIMSADESSESELSIEEKAKRALESGSWMALLWIFLGGVALSFTPCVYPVIPITIAYIGARSGGSRLKGFSLSLVFVLGLGLVYSTLGVVAAASGGVFGLSTQNTWVIGFVTIVFLIMGAGMMGAFDISLPSSLQTKLASKKRSGYLGALFVGATTGLVAAPCVGPVLVALLSWVSSTGNLFLGFLYLFVFAAGLGVLFVVIGTFAGVLSALPKAGGWMEMVKKVFGVILIAAAFYFGKSLVPENWFTLLTGLALLMLAGMMGGFSKLDGEAELGQKVFRGFASFILIIGAFYVLLGVARMEGIDPAAVSVSGRSQAVAGEKTADTGHGGINWVKNEIDVAFDQAKSSGRPVMIDFWAEWCAACKELDHKTFSQEEVYSIVNEKFVPLKIDGTKITDEVKSIWDRFGVRGLPTVLFMSPDGEEIERFEAFRTVEQVLPVLSRVSG